jgi:hypothetical protein
MKVLNFLFVSLFLITITSCSSARSTTREGIDLGQYRSFTLADNDDTYLPQISKVHKSQIEDAIMAEISKISSENLGVTGADVLVNYFVVVDTKTDIQTYNDYYRRRWRNLPINVELTYYKEGTLILDMIDAKSGKTIWNGSTSSVVTKNSIQLEETINKAVVSLFEKFVKDRTPKN